MKNAKEKVYKFNKMKNKIEYINRKHTQKLIIIHHLSQSAGGYGVVPSTSPHGENTCNSIALDQGCICWWRRTGYIPGVFSTGTEVGGLPGRRRNRKFEQPRNTYKALHVSAIEGKCGDYTGGNGVAT